MDQAKTQAKKNVNQEIIEDITSKGERLSLVRFRDAIQVDVPRGSYEVLTQAGPGTGGPLNQGKWNIWKYQNLLYIWHEDTGHVVEVPISNVVYMVPSAG
jgi:hypothetical protein